MYNGHRKDLQKRQNWHIGRKISCDCNLITVTDCECFVRQLKNILAETEVLSMSMILESAFLLVSLLMGINFMGQFCIISHLVASIFFREIQNYTSKR